MTSFCYLRILCKCNDERVVVGFTYSLFLLRNRCSSQQQHRAVYCCDPPGAKECASNSWKYILNLPFDRCNIAEGIVNNIKVINVADRPLHNHAFYASNVYHCYAVWHFYSIRSLFKLENLHEQVLRVVLNSHSSCYRNRFDKVFKPKL